MQTALQTKLLDYNATITLNKDFISISIPSGPNTTETFKWDYSGYDWHDCRPSFYKDEVDKVFLKALIFFISKGLITE